MLQEPIVYHSSSTIITLAWVLILTIVHHLVGEAIPRIAVGEFGSGGPLFCLADPGSRRGCGLDRRLQTVHL